MTYYPHPRGAGAPLKLNAETGFLESSKMDAFTVKKKMMFLDALRNNELNLTGTCKSVGVDYDTYLDHFRRDAKFRECVLKIKEDLVQRVEQVLATQAQDPKKTVDRIFFLKSHKPEVYNPGVGHGYNTTQIIFNVGAAQQAIDQRKVIDAEIVNDDATTPSETSDT